MLHRLRDLVLHEDDRPRYGVGRHVADVRARIEQHGEVPPRVQLLHPRGRCLLSEVVENGLLDLRALLFRLRVEELLHKPLVEFKLYAALPR